MLTFNAGRLVAGPSSSEGRQVSYMIWTIGVSWTSVIAGNTLILKSRPRDMAFDSVLVSLTTLHGVAKSILLKSSLIELEYNVIIILKNGT
jgi:hypothetical protein